MFCGSGTWTGTGLSGVRVFPRFCASARGLDDMEATVRGRSGGDVGCFTWTRLWTLYLTYVVVLGGEQVGAHVDNVRSEEKLHKQTRT